MATQFGFLLGFRDLELWLLPLETKSDGTIIYTMSGDSKSLLIGNSAAVADLAGTISATLTAAAGTEAGAVAQSAKDAATTTMTNLWQQFPEPFKTYVDKAISSCQFHLESLRLTLKITTIGTGATATKQYTGTYELGISVEINEAAPKPFDNFSMKRIFLKLTG